MIANLKIGLRIFLFFLRTRHLPGTYRKLFREISSCYLTSDAPGTAIIAGYKTRCTTNRQCMTVLLDGKLFFSINRDALTVREDSDQAELPLWNRRVRPLKVVFDNMIRHGVPFQISWTGGYRASDTHTVKMGLEN